MIRLSDSQRLRLARGEAHLVLALMGIVTGIFTGGVIILFRLGIEWSQAQFLPDGKIENYEALPTWLCFTLPLLGGILLGGLWQSLKPGHRSVGISHVMERLTSHQGKMPLINGLLQYLGASIAIVFGHSVGREGPSIHIGSTQAGLLGGFLRLPNNCLRILVACGTAAAIAASFNTPLAGVIFTMEVIVMEYTIAGFAPVILAAVSATSILRLVYGNEAAFIVPSFQLESLGDFPMILMLGVVTGILAGLFIQLVKLIDQSVQKIPIWLKFTMAGFVTGLIAMLYPQVMGIGYDTVNQALQGNLALGLVIGLVFAKFFASMVSVAMGLPAGFIGPTLVIGAMLGAVFAYLADLLLPGSIANPTPYVILGMGAMMSATLQAPLAALTALLELTLNPKIILPAMLALIVAKITTSEFLRQKSLTITLMELRNLVIKVDPLSQSLRRIGVVGVMNRQVLAMPAEVSLEQIQQALSAHPNWIVIQEAQEFQVAFPAADLHKILGEKQQQPNEQEAQIEEKEKIDLQEIPAQRYELSYVSSQANLAEAMKILRQEGAEALAVINKNVPGINRLEGIIFPKDIEESYRY